MCVAQEKWTRRPVECRAVFIPAMELSLRPDLAHFLRVRSYHHSLVVAQHVGHYYQHELDVASNTSAADRYVTVTATRPGFVYHLPCALITITRKR